MKSLIESRLSLRAKQDRVIGIAERLAMPLDVPISDCQYGAPTIAELKTMVFPDFEHSLDSFLESFAQD